MSSELRSFYLYDGYSERQHIDGWYRDILVGEVKTYDISQLFIAVNGVYTVLYFENLPRVDYKRHSSTKKHRYTIKRKVWSTHPGCVITRYINTNYGLKEKIGSRFLREDQLVITESNCCNYRLVIPVKHEFIPSTPPEIVTDWVLENELYSHKLTDKTNFSSNRTRIK